MSIVAHVMVGAAAGSLTSNSFIAGAAGFASHILMDLVPHYDPPLGKYSKTKSQEMLNWFLLAIDFSLGLAILWLVKDYPQMFWGGLVGGLVDLDTFYFQKLKHIGIPIHDINSGWHKQTTMIKGLFNQGLATFVAAAIIYSQLESQIRPYISLW